MKFLVSSILAVTLMIAPSWAAKPSSIPIEDFFSDVAYADVAISPTGQYFAIRSTKGVSDSIIIFDRENKNVAANFTFGEQQVFSGITWVNDNRFIFQGQRVEGHLDGSSSRSSWYAANADGSNRRGIFRTERSLMDLVHLLPNDPDHILVAKYHFADDYKAKVHRLNINDGRSYFVADQPNDVDSVLADNTGTLRAAYGLETNDELETTFTLYYKPFDQEQWVPLEIDGHEKGERINFIGFAADNRRAYLVGNYETETLVVYELDTKTGKLEMIAHDEIADVRGFAIDLDRQIIAVEFMPDRLRRVYVDTTESAKLLQSLEQAFPGQIVNLRNGTRDGKYAVVSVSSDRNAGEFYLFNTETLQASYIASSRPRLNSELLAEVTPFRMKASDGLELSGYLTMPKPDVFGSKPPLVVEVHGGPMGIQDIWRFDSQNQFLASRGIGVLQVNFRGSGGYGMAFRESGYREWGKAMQQDLYDATQWAIEQGYADKDRICISGGSYGAYAALMALSQKPNLYQCAIARGGVYDLPLLLSSTDGAGDERTRTSFARQMGDDMTALRAVSPITYTDKITQPILLMHGRNDVRTPFSQYQEMLKALQKHDKSVETWVHDGGHSVITQDDRFVEHQKILDFLSRHLALR